MTSFPDSKNINARIWTLANAVCEGTISDQEVEELESLLKADRNALLFYLDYLKINAEILWLVSAKQHSTMDSGPAVTLPPLLAPNRPPIFGFLGDLFNNHPLISFFSLFVILGASLLAGIFWLSGPHRANPPAEPEYIAQITVTKDCQWSSTAAPPTEKMQLQAGQRLLLEEGMVQITYSNGAVVLLEGPASFRIDSPKSGFLARGKLMARADTEESRQFKIITADARFEDLGTEFGVMIDDKGRSAVAVFAGKVKAEAKLADGRWTVPVSLGRGEAAVCEAAEFTRQVAQRNDFPTLEAHSQTPPPPFQRWLDASRELRNRGDLLAYYDFQPDLKSAKVLLNRAQTGAALNGEIQNAIWTQGRFAEKGALEFMSADAGVRVLLPGEYRQMTLIAWVSSKRLANKYNGILMSDNWNQPKKLHFQLQGSGQIIMHVCGQFTMRVNGQDYYSSAAAVPADRLDRWCMIAGVIDTPDSTSLYLNGEYFETLKSSQMPAVEVGSAMIGNWDKGTSRDLDSIRNLSGRIDELMIFKKALTAEEIKQIYEAGKP